MAEKDDLPNSSPIHPIIIPSPSSINSKGDNDIGVEVDFSKLIKNKNDKSGKKLWLDTDYMINMFSRPDLNNTDKKLLVFLCRSMSNTGQNIYSDKMIQSKTKISKPSLWRAIKKLIALNEIGRDVFGLLYIKGLRCDNRYASKIMSWSVLLEYLGYRVNTHDDNPDVCWEWTGETNVDGYGIIQIGARTEYAHRLAWKVHNGLISQNKVVHHIKPVCGNPKCCNIRHLKLMPKRKHDEFHKKERVGK